MNSQNARHEATRVTLIGMCLDLLLSAGKIVGGIFTNSFALVTDGIHSLTDAITDVFVIVMARVAHTAPDAEHQYGHRRFETLGTIAMGIVFFITAGILLYDSVKRLSTIDSIPIPGIAGIFIAAISIGSKEWIYQYTMRVARRLNSNLLRANAWHSRSDAISSIAVLIGIFGAQQGWVWMDVVAAMFVALIIAKIGWELCADSLRELVDTAIPPHRRALLESSILETEGIQAITELRSRLSGGKIILEARLQVNPRISVSEGHQLGEMACAALMGKFSDIEDVVFHIDPEPVSGESFRDEPGKNLELFPERSVILADIRSHWENLLDDADIDRMDLHYLDYGVEVDLTLKRDGLSTDMMEKLKTAVSELDYIISIRVFRKVYESKVDHALS